VVFSCISIISFYAYATDEDPVISTCISIISSYAYAADEDPAISTCISIISSYAYATDEDPVISTCISIISSYAYATDEDPVISSISGRCAEQETVATLVDGALVASHELATSVVAVATSTARTVCIARAPMTCAT